MSRGINKVILVGNLGQDPEIRYTPSGNAVSTISIATTDSWKDKNTGQLVERTEWHRVILFGKLAEVAAEYLRKGSQVYIEGRLQTRKWNDQAGVERFTTEIIVDTNGQMQMLGGRTPTPQPQPQPQPQPHINQQNNVTNRFSPQPMQSNGLGGALPPGFDDDDIPFG